MLLHRVTSNAVEISPLEERPWGEASNHMLQSLQSVASNCEQHLAVLALWIQGD